MRDWKTQAHVKWECKYHVVVLPKYRKKVIYGKIRHRVGEILRQLYRPEEIDLEEGNAMPDHIHMVLSVPPKYSVAMAIGFLKGKSAVRNFDIESADRPVPANYTLKVRPKFVMMPRNTR
jgi:putative transposase